MLPYLILGITYAFAAAVQPGPLQTYLISQTLSHGWRRTLPAAFSPLISDGPVIFLTLLVLSRVPAWMAQGLRLAGGVFVLYLAWGAQDMPPAPSSLLRAALVNLLNPNPYIAWSLVLGPLLLKAWRETPAHGVALLAGFYGTMVLSLAATIALFAAARNLGLRVTRVLIALSSAALACFAYYLLVAPAVLPPVFFPVRSARRAKENSPWRKPWEDDPSHRAPSVAEEGIRQLNGRRFLHAANAIGRNSGLLVAQPGLVRGPSVATGRHSHLNIRISLGHHPGEQFQAVAGFYEAPPLHHAHGFAAYLNSYRRSAPAVRWLSGAPALLCA